MFLEDRLAIIVKSKLDTGISTYWHQTHDVVYSQSPSGQRLRQIANQVRLKHVLAATKFYEDQNGFGGLLALSECLCRVNAVLLLGRSGVYELRLLIVGVGCCHVFQTAVSW